MMKKYLFIGLLLASCNPVKKALKVASNNPSEFLNFCAEKFPATDALVTRDSISFDTLYVESYPIISTTWQKDTVLKTVFFPGTTQFVTKTVRKDSIITRVDNAALKAKQKENDDLIVVNKDYVARNNGLSWWKRACIITWISIVIILVLRAIIKSYLKK